MKKMICIAGLALMLSCKMYAPDTEVEVCDEPPETMSEMIERIVGNEHASLVEAIISVESNFNPDIISRTGDYGLMQINRYWWESEFDWDKILDSEYNVEAGYQILSLCLVKADDDIQKALQKYNGGSVYPHLVNEKHFQMYNKYLF